MGDEYMNTEQVLMTTTTRLRKRCSRIMNHLSLSGTGLVGELKTETLRWGGGGGGGRRSLRSPTGGCEAKNGCEGEGGRGGSGGEPELRGGQGDWVLESQWRCLDPEGMFGCALLLQLNSGEIFTHLLDHRLGSPHL